METFNGTNERREIDDVLNDVFIQLWSRVDRFLEEKRLQGFLVTMARRRALDRSRRRLAYRRATDRLEIQMMTEFNDKMVRPQMKSTTFRFMRAPFPNDPFVAGAATGGSGADISQRDESTRNRCTKIDFFGHSEDPVTPGSKETVESIGANSEQNLRSQKGSREKLEVVRGAFQI